MKAMLIRLARRFAMLLGVLAVLFVIVLILNDGNLDTALNVFAGTVWIGGIALIAVYALVTKTLARRRKVIEILEEARKKKEARAAVAPRQKTE